MSSNSSFPNLSGLSVIKEKYRTKNSVIYLVKNESLNKITILKSIQKSYISPKAYEMLKRERDFYSSNLSPDLFPSFIKPYKDDNNLYIEMTFIEGINFSKLLTDEHILIFSDKSKSNFNLYLNIISQIIYIMYILHTNNYCYRDLKLNNLIMDDTGYLKIIDFGIAKDITGKDKTNTIIGTYKYMAPEMIKGNGYSFNVDYWAMGIILYEWFYGKVPFGYGIEDPTKIYKDICERNPIFPSDVKNEKFNDFLKNLLVKKPKKRYTNIEIIKKHPFFNDIDFDKVLKHEVIAPYIPKISNIDDENNNEMIQTPFTEFMKNHVFCSSTELDELIEKNKKANDLFSDF
jgi:cGMP-dependent protein kinase